MKNQNTTTTRPNVWELANHEEEMKLCGAVRYIDLHAMFRSNGGDDVIMGLIKGCYLDKLAFANADHQYTIQNLEALKDSARTDAKNARNQLKRLTINEEDRAKAERKLDESTYTADNLLDEIKDIEKADKAHTVSLAEDMLHVIYLELQAIKADPARHTERAFGELCKAGREYITKMTAVSCIDGMNTTRRPLTKAEAVALMVRYDVNPGARPRQKWAQNGLGCTGYYTLEADLLKRDTDHRKVDPATVAQYMRYNDAVIWYYENVTLKATHSTHATAWPALDAKAIALRHWDNMTQSQKAVALDLDPADNSLLYEVCHVPTIRTHHSTEEIGDKDPRNAEAVTASALRAVDVPAIANRANLTSREREAVAIMATAEAVALARTAYREALDKGQKAVEKLQEDRAKAGKKPYTPAKIRQMVEQYQTSANNTYESTLWEYAMREAGFKGKDLSKTKDRIIKPMRKAQRNAPEALTPGRVDYARMMQSISRGQATDNTARPDMVTVWTTATAYIIKDKDGNEHTVKAPKDHKPVIRWEDSGKPVEAMTREEAEELAKATERERVAHLTAYADNINFVEYRRRMRYEPARTAWEALNATKSAMVFLDHMTAEEQAEVMRARRAERAEDSERLRATAEQNRQTWAEAWSARPVHTISPADWNKLSGRDRVALLDRIHVEGKRLEVKKA